MEVTFSDEVPATVSPLKSFVGEDLVSDDGKWQLQQDGFRASRLSSSFELIQPSGLELLGVILYFQGDRLCAKMFRWWSCLILSGEKQPERTSFRQGIGAGGFCVFQRYMVSDELYEDSKMNKRWARKKRCRWGRYMFLPNSFELLVTRHIILRWYNKLP